MMMNHIRTMCGTMALALLLAAGPVHAFQRLESCYSMLSLEQPASDGHKALYILIDQTMPLTPAMQDSILTLISDWNRSGDRIKIARFSANTKGQFTELMYDAVMDIEPSEEYLYHLRDRDHDKLLECLAQRKEQFTRSFHEAFKTVMSGVNPRLPKTDIFYALSKLSDMVLEDRGVQDKTVLLITDGLENSNYTSFHKRKTIERINPEKELLKLSTKQLVTEWFNAKVYIYGLGYVEDKEVYLTPDTLEPLKEFWRLYFTAGHGDVRGLGTPALLVNSLK